MYVEPSPATGAKYQITTGNGHHPVWLPDGKGLSYRVSGNQQVVVSINTTPSFSIGNPRPRSRGTTDGPQSRLKVLRHHAGWCRLPDNRRSVGISTLIETREIQIVLNWHEELKRLVPTKFRPRTPQSRLSER